MLFKLNREKTAKETAALFHIYINVLYMKKHSGFFSKTAPVGV